MKVSNPGRHRVLMSAGCLLVVVAISGLSLFAQAPGTGAGVPAQPGALPPVNTGAADLPVSPSTTAAAPGAGNATTGAFPPSLSTLRPDALPGPELSAPVAVNPAGSGFGAPGGGAPPSTGGLTPAGGLPGGFGPGPTGYIGGGMPMPPGAFGQGPSPEWALEQEIKSLLKAYRTHPADPTVRAQLSKTLNDYVTQQFKIRQERRENEIKAIEAELARVKKLHESRVANQEAIIATRVKDLLSTAEGLGWDMPEETSVPGPGAGPIPTLLLPTPNQ